MFLRIWRFIIIILAALTTATTFAHALELPAKMNYDAALWTTLQQSLYWGFGHIGGYVEAAMGILARSTFCPAFDGAGRAADVCSG